jgi:cytochrome c oxidase assembly protein subunit 15
MSVPRLSPRMYAHLTLIAAVAVGFIIVTGAAVRLTGSGLGCPDWPTCAHGHVVAALGNHQKVEDGNRAVTAAVSVAVVLAVLGSLVRTPRRRDLTLLSIGLVLGVLGQIVLGGLTVLYKLEPPFVMGHFLLSMVLLADAVVLHHRAGSPDGPSRPVVDRDLLRLGRLLAATAAITIVAGTVVTSSGPHGGDARAPRWDFSLHRVTQIHGTAAMLTVAMTLAMMALLQANRAPLLAQQRARTVLEALAAQVTIGYVQYFTGVPALLVGFHVLGAVLVWAAVLRFNLVLTAPAAPVESVPGLVLTPT